MLRVPCRSCQDNVRTSTWQCQTIFADNGAISFSSIDFLADSRCCLANASLPSHENMHIVLLHTKSAGHVWNIVTAGFVGHFAPNVDVFCFWVTP